MIVWTIDPDWRRDQIIQAWHIGAITADHARHLLATCPEPVGQVIRPHTPTPIQAYGVAGLDAAVQAHRAATRTQAVFDAALAGSITTAQARELLTMPAMEPAPDQLNVEYDGAMLRVLIEEDEERRHELPARRDCTPAQRAAVSAHWSTALRAKVAASAAADKERERTRVVLDCAEDM